MTKCILLLATCAGMLAACNSNTTNPLQIQTRIIDSTVNANVTKHDAENAAKNDSILNAMAKMQADTIAKQNASQAKKLPKKTEKSTDNTSAPAANTTPATSK